MIACWKLNLVPGFLMLTILVWFYVVFLAILLIFVWKPPRFSYKMGNYIKVLNRHIYIKRILTCSERP